MSGSDYTTLPDDEIEFAPDLPKVEPDGAFAVRASEIEREQLSSLWPGRVPFGHISLFTGVPGVFKSMLTIWLTARLTRGELGERCDVVLATAEDSLGATVRPRLEAAQAELDRVHFLRMRREGVEGDVSLPDDLDELRRIVLALGPCLVIIDPIVAHLVGGVDTHRDAEVRRVLAPLHHLAQESGCAVVGVMHLNKGSGTDPLTRIGGSTGFAGLARSVLLLARDPEDPAGETGNFRVVAHAKNNLGPLAPSVRFELMPMLLPGRGNEPDVETARLEERGVCALAASDLLRSPEPVSAPERAKAFLMAMVTDEPVLAGEVYEAGKAEGHSQRSLERAASELRDEGALVAQTRPGKPPSHWWRLAVPPTTGDGSGGTGAGGTENHGEGLPSRQGAGETEKTASEAAERLTEAPVPPTAGGTGGTEGTAAVPPTETDRGGLGGTGLSAWVCPRCGREGQPQSVVAGVAFCRCGGQETVADESAVSLTEEFRSEGGPA